MLRKTVREFGDDHCTDLAAALTYYAVLALFPAAIALISLLGVVGQGQSSVDNVISAVPTLNPHRGAINIGAVEAVRLGPPGAALVYHERAYKRV